LIRRALTLLACAAAALAAVPNPADFGMAEFNAAVAARGLKIRPKITAELNLDPPETWRIDTYAAGGAHITGGDLRGLMYALLEAADEIRTTGKLKIAKGAPALPIRGVRMAALTEATWFASADFWRSYFADLARARFNRVQLIFAGNPGERDMAAVRMISQAGAEYGVDLVIGLNEASPESVERLMEDCPLLRAVAIHQAPADVRPLFQALRAVGRRAVLELPASATAPATGPVRYFASYGEIPESKPGDFYIKLEAPQVAQDPESVRAFLAGLTSGFEIASPTGPDGRPDAAKIAAWGKLGYNPK
jgi:hypothetical protein